MNEIMISGKQPTGWDVRMLGQVFRERKEKGSDSEFPALSVTMQGILPQLETAAKTDRGDDRKVVRVGDYVINSRSDRKGSGGISALEGSVSLISIVMEPFGIVPEFAHHLLRSVAFQEEFYRFGRGIVADLWSTRFDDLKRIQVFLPTKDRQVAIASFLDRETARIDALIEKKTRFIELLKEKRQALITQAVTKGLDPNVPMRDSGVEWIGEVPEGWDVRKVRYLCRSISGGTPDRNNPAFWGGEIHWVTPKDMKRSRITSALESITQVGLAKSSAKIAKPGSVLIVFRSGILQHTIPIAINTTPVAINQDIRAFSFSSDVHPEFFEYFVSGLNDALLLEWCKPGSTVESIETELMNESLIPLPPISEQHEICKALALHCSRIDRLQQRTIESIELLKERRSALINAAVTGQIDLRESA